MTLKKGNNTKAISPKGLSASVIDGALEGMSINIDQDAVSRGYIDIPLSQAALLPDTDLPNSEIRYYIFQTGVREFVLSVKKVYP